MTAPNLGRLTTVPPRKVWTHEAQDFTPWLLQNVFNVLSDLLGMNLVRRLLRELDAELALALALACERAGESLEWSAQDKKVLELIANQVDRMSDIAADYEAAEDAKVRVKLSAELRLLEGSLAQPLKQVNTDVPEPESLTTIKARRAVMGCHPNAAG